MSLKAATIIALCGSALSLILGLKNVFISLVPALGELFYRGPVGVFFQVLGLLVPLSFIIFFITLASKQGKGA